MKSAIFLIGLLMPVAAAAQSSNAMNLNLNGVPTAPTAAVGTNSNQVATTAFVQANSGSVGSNLSGSLINLPGMPGRSLSARAADIYNVRDYGALGTNTPTTLASQFPASATASLSSFAAQSVNGSTPYAWMTNPAFGLTFSMSTSIDQGGAGTSLTFLRPLTGINNWSASVAAWQAPGSGNDLLATGMQVSGSCIASGSTVAAVGRTAGAAGYGTVTLSQPSAADCASGAAITFTISPSQLQALTMDWLGIQGAMAAGWQNAQAGGAVYMPGGNYVINHSLINAGGVVDTSFNVPNLDVRGDGVAETRLSFPSDLGGDACAILSGGRGVPLTSLSSYHDFRIIGPSFSRVVGTMPSQMDGLCVGADDKASGLSVSNMRAGVNGVKDHWAIRDVTLSNNGYGIYFAPYSSTIGNQIIENSSLVGNTVASVGVATTNQIDAALISNVHTGFAPYGFYYEPNPGNVGNGLNNLLTNSTLTNVYIEAVGNGWIYGAGGKGAVIRNVFINGGPSDVGTQTNYAMPNGSGGASKAPAVVYVNEFQSNTMLGTCWTSYGSVTDAIVETGDRTTGNAWINDPAFISNATTTVWPIKAPGGMNNNTFQTPWGSGVFRRAGVAATANMAVYDTGSFLVIPYVDGKSFSGITAAPASQNETVAVVTAADFESVAKADPTQSIAGGQPVFETTNGVAGGLDQNGAIGTAVGYSGAGTATVYIDLDPGANAGAPGVATGLTAAGNSQASAFKVTASIDCFTGVAAGTGAVLAAVPVGDAIVIYNDGGNGLTVYPQAGGQIGSASANAGVSIAAGSSASFRRLSSTLWHQ